MCPSAQCFSHRVAFLLGSAFAVIRVATSTAGPLQLQQENFTSFTEGLPSNQGVLLEFYANWCPTCQHFQPDYEKVAGYFNAEPRVKPEVTVARMDCATESKLCNQFGIGRYPTLKYGLPALFSEEESQKLVEYKGNRQPADIVQWIGQQKGVEYNFDPTQDAQDVRRSTTVAVVATESGLPLMIANEADLQDIEKATVLAFKYALDSTELLKGLESRQAFKDFVDVVAAAHPADKCRAGAAKFQEALPQLWPAEQAEGPEAALKDIQICGDQDADLDWRACKGSKENKRGYTCGLWMAFHSLAGRTEPQDSGGALWLAAIKGYVKHFFQCTDCANHFTEMASETAARAVMSRRHAVLWAWRAHNESGKAAARHGHDLPARMSALGGIHDAQVNRRLESLEKTSGEGDPAFPKMQWPPSELCPLCRLPSINKKADVTWNEEEVYRFLLMYYHGIPEPGWVTQKLGAGSNLLGLGGRKNLVSRQADGGQRSHVGLLLLGVGILGAAGFVIRQRLRRGRKQAW